MLKNQNRFGEHIAYIDGDGRPDWRGVKFSPFALFSCRCQIAISANSGLTEQLKNIKMFLPMIKLSALFLVHSHNARQEQQSITK